MRDLASVFMGLSFERGSGVLKKQQLGAHVRGHFRPLMFFIFSVIRRLIIGFYIINQARLEGGFEKPLKGEVEIQEKIELKNPLRLQGFPLDVWPSTYVKKQYHSLNISVAKQRTITIIKEAL